MKKVACCGTFDLFHDGHKHLLSTASTYGRLHVFVIGASIVRSNKNRSTRHSLAERMRNVQDFVTSAIVHCMDREPVFHTRQVLDLNPDYYCFGEDQINQWNQELKNLLEKQGCNCFVVPRLPGISTTNLLKR